MNTDPINEQAACVKRVREGERRTEGPLPCPFCQVNIELKTGWWEHPANECFFNHHAWHSTRINQTKLWNTRARPESADTARLDFLEQLLKACPHAAIAFNDDPDVETDDTDSGFAPIGYRIVTDGCQGIRIDVGPTLRAAIDAALPPEPEPQAAPGESWRMMEAGEVIREGDECLGSDGKWFKAHLREPLERHSVGKYRRRPTAEELASEIAIKIYGAPPAFEQHTYELILAAFATIRQQHAEEVAGYRLVIQINGSQHETIVSDLRRELEKEWIKNGDLREQIEQLTDRLDGLRTALAAEAHDREELSEQWTRDSEALHRERDQLRREVAEKTRALTLQRDCHARATDAFSPACGECIACLKYERDEQQGALATAQRERDAALRRVAELEAERQ